MNASLVGVVLLLFIAITTVNSLACTQQWQCTSVSTDYNYVTCSGGQCRCKASQGFVGNATSQNRCTCLQPNSVTWSGGEPYCLNIATATLLQVEDARSEILKAKTRKVYTNLIFPTAGQIIQGLISVDDLFADNAKGRIDPVGTFNSRTLLKEYYYVFGSIPLNPVTAVYFKDEVAEGDEVFIRVDIFFESSIPGGRSFNITQSGRYKYGPDNRIVSVEAIIHNMGKAADPNPAFIPFIIDDMCNTYRTHCNLANDPLGYYTSKEDCVQFISSLPYNSYDRSSSNSGVCRSVHNTIVPFDPEVHCSHVGRTGGGKCVDTPYEDYYTVSY